MTLDIEYSKGTCVVQEIEDDFISFEFFPSSQNKESFESAEFDNVFKTKTVADMNITLYELSYPKEITRDELKDVLNKVQDFAREIGDKSK